MRPRALLLAALVGWIAPPATNAFADDAAAARFHDQRARAHFAAREYEDAIREFFLVQRISPNARNVFNIATCFQLLGRHAEAFQMFTEYLAGQEDDEGRRARAREAIAQLAPEVARLAVTTDPPDARIYVDRPEHGAYARAPGVVAVEPGEHTVFVELDGYRGAEATVTAERGRETEVTLTLEARTGELRVLSEVEGQAQVRTPAGEVAAQGSTPLSAQLIPGPYEIVVTADGYEAYRGLAEVREAESVEHTASLAVLPETRGQLTVTANQPGALVTIDDTPAGFTPLVLEDIEVGVRSVSVGRDGLDPWSGHVEILSDSPAWLTLTMESENPEDVHSPATWLLGGTGLAVLGAGGVVAGFAVEARAGFEEAQRNPAIDIGAYRQRGETLNVVADVLFAVGATTLIAAAVLFLVEELQPPSRSSASISRSETVLDPEDP